MAVPAGCSSIAPGLRSSLEAAMGLEVEADRMVRATANATVTLASNTVKAKATTIAAVAQKVINANQERLRLKAPPSKVQYDAGPAHGSSLRKFMAMVPGHMNSR